MRSFAMLAAALAIGTAWAAPAVADPQTCIQVTYVDRTTFVSPRTLLFHMKDGKVWRNTLKTDCLGLRFHGFAYVVRGETVCGNAQAIQVIDNGQVCLLGPFTPDTVSKPEPSPS